MSLWYDYIMSDIGSVESSPSNIENDLIATEGKVITALFSKKWKADRPPSYTSDTLKKSRSDRLIQTESDSTESNSTVSYSILNSLNPEYETKSSPYKIDRITLDPNHKFVAIDIKSQTASPSSMERFEVVMKKDDKDISGMKMSIGYYDPAGKDYRPVMLEYSAQVGTDTEITPSGQKIVTKGSRFSEDLIARQFAYKEALERLAASMQENGINIDHNTRLVYIYSKRNDPNLVMELCREQIQYKNEDLANRLESLTKIYKHAEETDEFYDHYWAEVANFTRSIMPQHDPLLQPFYMLDVSPNYIGIHRNVYTKPTRDVVDEQEKVLAIPTHGISYDDEGKIVITPQGKFDAVEPILNREGVHIKAIPKAIRCSYSKDGTLHTILDTESMDISTSPQEIDFYCKQSVKITEGDQQFTVYPILQTGSNNQIYNGIVIEGLDSQPVFYPNIYFKNIT